MNNSRLKLISKFFSFLLLVPALQVSMPAFAAENTDLLGNESPLFRGEELFQTGSYVAAVDIFKMADGLDRNEGIVGASRSLAMLGRYDEAIALCEETIDGGDYVDFPLVATELAEVKRMVGQSAEALEILAAVIDDDFQGAPVRTLVQYGSLLKFVGEKGQAFNYLESAVQRYNDGLVFASEDVAMVALANWLLDRFHDANSMFNEAVRANPNNLEAHTLWGDLFLEKYNAADAEQSYQEALEINGRYVPALIGLTKVNGDQRSLQRAMAINPNSVDAMQTYALGMIRSNRKDEAKGFLDQALAINPESLMVLSTLATEAKLFEREDEYQELLAQVESFSPNNPIFLGNIADAYGNNYRFDEAVEFANAAIAADPTYWQGYTLLGSNQIRLGEEIEGKANLEIGYENDPFNVLTSNMLKVFDTLATYETRESEHFKVHMSQNDADILWPYMEPLLEEAWDTLSSKYGFEPESPVLIEVFENSEDFAVRSVGLPDIGPLVGICFGKVITLISPDTLTANWQEIVWHEFMHVITLQMTDNKMPRWLSEGISVWEESQGRPYWGRRQGLDLVRAVEDNKLFAVGDLNSSFTGAQNNADLGFAYFQSYLVVDYITDEFGFETLVDLVKQYVQIKEENLIFIDVFDQSLDEFNDGFVDWIVGRVEEINVYVHNEDVPDEGEGHGHGIRENSSAILAELYNNASLKQHMRSRIESEPRDFQAYLQLGIVLFKEDNFDEAKTYLNMAHDLLPNYTGYPSPPLVLSQIYEREGNSAAQLEQLEILLDNQQHDYDSAMTLANASVASGDIEKANYFLDRALQIDPYRIDVHRLKAQYAELIEDPQLAVTEHEVLVKLDINDPVEAQTNLAEAYLNNGQVNEAKRNVLTALEIAPSYLRAQQILLQSVDSANQ